MNTYLGLKKDTAVLMFKTVKEKSSFAKKISNSSSI